MCKPRRSEQQDAAPATGPTTRLSHNESIAAAQHTAVRSQACGPFTFPWWTLWLIWPLIGLFKVAAPALIGAVGVLSQWTVPLLPLLLIALGAALLLARRRDT